jgi:hypothetical protein
MCSNVKLTWHRELGLGPVPVMFARYFSRKQIQMKNPCTCKGLLDWFGYRKIKSLRGILIQVITTASLILPVFAHAELGDMTLTVPMLDSQVVLQTEAKFGGAVTSLIFRGKEHIDRSDHGRLLQSASSFDGLGECYNPTEGGASRLSKNQEASVVKAASMEGNQLRTTAAMAFFLAPGRAYPKGCGSKKYLKQAVNETETSNHILEKQLTVGIPNFPNVIEHKVIFQVPDNFSHGIFEASTGYLPKEFSDAVYYDPKQNKEVHSDKSQGEQALPVILFTADKRYAMGVYSPELPQKGLKVGYGRSTFPGGNKWNCVFRENKVKPGPYEYRCMVVLGTLEEVEDTMNRLNKKFRGENR